MWDRAVAQEADCVYALVGTGGNRAVPESLASGLKRKNRWPSSQAEQGKSADENFHVLKQVV